MFILETASVEAVSVMSKTEGVIQVNHPELGRTGRQVAWVWIQEPPF